MAKNKYLTRRGYREWLQDTIFNEGEDVQVGMTRVINECPIALYLGFQTNREWHASALACVPIVHLEAEDHEFKTPKWAREYIHALDRHFGKLPTPISAGNALYVLDEAVR